MYTLLGCGANSLAWTAQTWCGLLNEICPPTAVYLNTWSPVDRAVWGDYGSFRGTALLKEVLHWGWALRIYSLTPLPASRVDKNVTSQPPASTTCLAVPTTMDSVPLNCQPK